MAYVIFIAFFYILWHFSDAKLLLLLQLCIKEKIYSNFAWSSKNFPVIQREMSVNSYFLHP